MNHQIELNLYIDIELIVYIYICVCVCVWLCVCVCVCVCVFSNPSARAGCDTRLIFKPEFNTFEFLVFLLL